MTLPRKSSVHVSRLSKRSVYLGLSGIALSGLFTAACVHVGKGSQFLTKNSILSNCAQPTTTPAKFVLLADSHISNVTGYGIYKHVSDESESITRVAKRPPQLDFWSDNVLDWLVRHEQKEDPTVPFIHLGDAANIACTGEFSRFARVMKGQFTHAGRDGQPLSPISPIWYMAPGNHDVYFVGNFAYETSVQYQRDDDPTGCPPPGASALMSPPKGGVPDKGEFALSGKGINYDDQPASKPLGNGSGPPGRTPGFWDGECAGGGRPMDKNQFLDLYLAELRARNLAISSPPVDTNCDSVIEENNVANPYNLLSGQQPVNELLSRIYYCKNNKGATFKSFIIQDIALNDNLHIILLDSTQRSDTPRKRLAFSLPGVHGSLLDSQLAVVRAWLAADKAANKETRYLLGSHHPIYNFSQSTKRDLRELFQSYPVLAYMSAHTHSASALRKHKREQPGDSFIELNVGSVLDWPMEYAVIDAQQINPATATVLGTEKQAKAAVGKWELDVRVNSLTHMWEHPSLYADAPRCDCQQQRDYKQYIDYRGFAASGGLKHHDRQIKELFTWVARPATSQPASSCADGQSRTVDACSVRSSVTAQLDTDLRGFEAQASKCHTYAALGYQLSLMRDRLREPDVIETLDPDYPLCQARWASEAERTTPAGISAIVRDVEYSSLAEIVRLRADGQPSGQWRLILHSKE